MSHDPPPPEDDPVVEELDVFLSQTLAKSLFLFQHILRAPDRGYDFAKLTEVRFKPNACLVHFDLALDVNGPHYNPSASPPITKLTVASSTPPAETNYAIGVRRGGELHLTPLCAVAQLRPSFHYVDEARAAAQREEMGESAEHEEKKEARDEVGIPIQVQFRRRETEKAAEFRKSTHAYLHAKEEEEEWIPLVFYPDNSEASLDHMGHLYTAPEDLQHSIPLDLSAQGYIDALDRRMERLRTHGEQNGSAAGLSRYTLRHLPSHEQVKTLMYHVHVMQFRRIREILPELEDEELLRAIEEEAVLVQGCWVVKSELVWSGSAITARDFLLTMFRSSRLVKRKIFQDATSVAPDIAARLLGQLAILRPGEGWEWKVPTDQAFAMAHPDCVARQEVLWEERTARIMDSLTRSSATSVTSTSLAFPSGNPSAITGMPGSVHAVSMDLEPARAVPSAPLTPEVERCLTTFLLENFRLHGVCSFGYLERKLAERQREARPGDLLVSNLPTDAFRAVLETTARHVSNDLYVQRSLNNPDMDKYRDVVAGLFASRLSVKRADINQAVRTELGEQEIPPNSYLRIMREFAMSRGSQWVLKGGE